MFEIKLSNAKGDKLITSFTTSVDTLSEAEVIAKGEVGGCLGTYEIELLHLENLVYAVTNSKRCLGLVSIRTCKERKDRQM